MTIPDDVRWLIVLCCTVTGCAERATISEYEVAQENERGLTSEVLRDQFPPVPFRWDVPENWRVADNDQFSRLAWTTGSPVDAARITVGSFPSSAGVEAQVVRWRRQLGLETPDTDTAMRNVQPIETRGGAGSFVAIDGARESIQALILPIDDSLWIVRYKSSLERAKDQADAFRTFCESAEYVEMKTETPSGPTAESASDETGG